ncbi:MAG: hypothetical protein AB2L24_19465 [Mangrovibacterium sp.]
MQDGIVWRTDSRFGFVVGQRPETDFLPPGKMHFLARPGAVNNGGAFFSAVFQRKTNGLAYRVNAATQINGNAATGKSLFFFESADGLLSLFYRAKRRFHRT